MITFTNGNMFACEADILVNTVNCIGKMGKGLAEEFKYRYPKMHKDYVKACDDNRVRIGVPHVWTSNDLFAPVTIINFPTKKHWANDSKYEYILEGLDWLRNYLLQHPDKSIAIPPLGCGNGNLDWNIVGGLIANVLSGLDNKITIFEPNL